MNEARTLGELVRAAKDRRDTSSRQLAAQAQRAGFRIVDTTLNAIAAGTYKSRPSEDTIRAIAWLAGVDDADAFRAAGLRVPGPPFADELPPGVDYLSPEARKAVIGVLRVLVQQEEVVGDGEAKRDAAPTTAGGAEEAEPNGAAAGSEQVVEERFVRTRSTSFRAGEPQPEATPRPSAESKARGRS